MATGPAPPSAHPSCQAAQDCLMLSPQQVPGTGSRGGSAMAIGVDAGGGEGSRTVDPRIMAEQLRLFCRQSRVSVFGHAFVALATAALLYTQPVDRTALVAWVAVAILVAVVRLLIYRRFPAASADPSALRRWPVLFQAMSFLSGCVFGGLAVLFLDPAMPEVTGWILLIESGVLGAAMGAFAIYGRAYRWYLAAILLPLIAMLLTFARLDMAFVALLAAGFGVYLQHFSRGVEAVLLGQIGGRLENADLAEQVARHGALLRSAIQAIPNAIVVVDAEGRFLDHNDRFRRLFDLPDTLFETPLTLRLFNRLRQDVARHRVWPHVTPRLATTPPLKQLRDQPLSGH
ncbi:MAG: PAS domain-containing protein [Sneathiellaceae bacterium]